jgi:hypothetical protein
MIIHSVRSQYRLTRALFVVIAFTRIQFHQEMPVIALAPGRPSYDDPLGLKLWSRMKNAWRSFYMRLHRHNQERYEIVTMKV